MSPRVPLRAGMRLEGGLASRMKRGRQWSQGQELLQSSLLEQCRVGNWESEKMQSRQEGGCAVLMNTGQCSSSHIFRECTLYNKRPFCCYRRAGTLPVSPLGPEEHPTSTP